MGKPISVNPLKTSPALGAAFALQGIRGTLPLFHAAPGCTFLGKVLLTRHMREPVGLLGSDMKEMSTILGGWDLLSDKVREIHGKQKPEMIAVISTALSEVRGEDAEGIVSALREENPDLNLLLVSAPDFKGGFSEGYASAVEALIRQFARGGERISDRVNLIPGAHLTPGDVEELKELVELFGLEAVVLPDLSLSMDGSKEKFSAAPLDGTGVEELASPGSSAATIVIGEAVRSCGELLEESFGVPLYYLEGATGLEASDELIKILMKISGREVPARIRRWRNRLVDGMVDTHLFLYGKRAALALEAEQVSAVASFLKEVGVEVRKAVVPSLSHALKESDLPVTAGDLEDLELALGEARMAGEGIDVLISNSHALEVSHRTGIPLIATGFPVYHRFGETTKVRAGYRGTLNFLFELANLFLEGMHHEENPEESVFEDKKEHSILSGYGEGAIR